MVVFAAYVRQWVEANPGKINDRDSQGLTVLVAAACELENLPLTLWLLDEKGADVNARWAGGRTALMFARCPDIISALLARGADPTLTEDKGWTSLIAQVSTGHANAVARLLEEPRVRATIDMQHNTGWTALHCACSLHGRGDGSLAATMAHVLLQAGANPNITNNSSLTPVRMIGQLYQHHHIITVLRLVPDAEKAALLVKARRLVVAAAGTHGVVPSSLQRRLAQGQPCGDGAVDG